MTREDYIRKLMDIQELCNDIILADRNGGWQGMAEDMADKILGIIRA